MNPQSLADIEGREVAFNRILNAPIDLVFEVWSKPEHLAQWWGPNGFTLTTHEMDFKSGGHWTFTMHGPEGHDFPNKILYLEVDRTERIEYQHAGDGETEDINFHVTVTFSDIGGKTEVLMRMIFSERSVLERVERDYNAIQGGNENIARMQAYAEGLV